MTLDPIIISGPTGSGKSALALDLAERLGGAILCADSRQLYENMRIGTAGPTQKEEARVPHYLFHFLSLNEKYSAGRYIREVDHVLSKLKSDGLRPIIVGGSGLYLRALRFGLSDVPPSSPATRAHLEEECGRVGPREMHERLAAIDPLRAQAIESTDALRIVRALEIFQITGKIPSEQRRVDLSAVSRIEASWFLLEASPEHLDPRLKRRVRVMLNSGLLAEEKSLADRYGKDHKLLDTMGYREARMLRLGTVSENECIELIFRRQRRYAKRQRTWSNKEPWWTRLDAFQPRLAEKLLDTLYD